MKQIEFKNVSKVYGNGIRALNNVTVSINRGEFLYLIGPSGSGKTTFLKLIYREELPTEGEVIVEGRNIVNLSGNDIAYFRRNIGIVFQDFKLIPYWTIFENIAFSLIVTGYPEEKIRQQVEWVLKKVDLLYKKNMYPLQLSGGEQQRAAIARAIVTQPAILLTDEPTGNLDPFISLEIMHLLEDINSEGTTIIMVTHNKDIVEEYPKRIIALKDGVKTRDDMEGKYWYS